MSTITENKHKREKNLRHIGSYNW